MLAISVMADEVVVVRHHGEEMRIYLGRRQQKGKAAGIAIQAPTSFGVTREKRSPGEKSPVDGTEVG